MPGRNCAQRADRISLLGTEPPRILVTRPLPQAERTAERLRALGYVPVLAPMLRIEPINPPDPPEFNNVQAILATSTNGIERLVALTDVRSVAVLTVGTRTAAAAAKAGFTDVHSASGDGHSLLDLAINKLTPDAGKVIHIRGRHAAVAFDALADQGYDFHELIAYQAIEEPELPLPALHPAPAAAVLYSARTSSALARAARSAGFDLSKIALIGISTAALAPLEALDARTKVAKTPDEDALLAILKEVMPLP